MNADIKPIERLIDLGSLLGVSRRTVSSYIEEGYIKKPVRDTDGVLWFDEQDVKEALKITGEIGELITKEQTLELMKDLGIKRELKYLTANGFITKYKIVNNNGNKDYYMKTQIEELVDQHSIKVMRTDPASAYNSSLAFFGMKLLLNGISHLDTSLTEREFDCLKKCFCDGLSNVEVAEMFDLTPTRIGQIQQRGVQRLFNQLRNTLSSNIELFNSNTALQSELHELNMKYNAIIKHNELTEQKVNEIISPEKRKLIDLLNSKLADHDFEVRALNCFKANDIYTFRDLVSLDKKQLFKWRNFGHKTIAHIEEMLLDRGLHFGMKDIVYRFI